jgi:hypothetical protein
MPQSQTFDVASAHSSHGPADTRRSDTVGGTGGKGALGGGDALGKRSGS